MSLNDSWILRMVHRRYLKLPTVHCIWILDASDTVHRENIAAREKWETIHPPTSHSRGLPAMLEMVFVSRYVVGVIFYVNNNIYGYLRVLHQCLRYETKLSCTCIYTHVTPTTIQYCSNYTIFHSNCIKLQDNIHQCHPLLPQFLV